MQYSSPAHPTAVPDILTIVARAELGFQISHTEARGRRKEADSCGERHVGVAGAGRPGPGPARTVQGQEDTALAETEEKLGARSTTFHAATADERDATRRFAGVTTIYRLASQTSPHQDGSLLPSKWCVCFEDVGILDWDRATWTDAYLSPPPFSLRIPLRRPLSYLFPISFILIFSFALALSFPPVLAKLSIYRERGRERRSRDPLGRSYVYYGFHTTIPICSAFGGHLSVFVIKGSILPARDCAGGGEASMEQEASAC